LIYCIKFLTSYWFKRGIYVRGRSQCTFYLFSGTRKK
jgi:hypothetical protein